MNGFFDTILNLVVTTKESRRYKQLCEDPEAAAHSTHFGKKFIQNAIGALILNAFAIGFGALAIILMAREIDLASGFVLIGYIACIACDVLLAIYAVVLILSRLKFVKWQRRLNDLPIGQKARIFAFVTVPCVIALSVLAVVLIVISLI